MPYPNQDNVLGFCLNLATKDKILILTMTMGNVSYLAGRSNILN